MARNEITFQVNLKKDTNSASRTYGMYFGEAESKEPLNLKGFAKHLTEHGKLTTYEMMVLVLQNIVSCMKELICQGQPVKLEGLGTFYPTIENKKGGVESPLAYDPNVQIEGVHLRFLPEGAKGEELTSRNLKGDCVFEMRDLITVHVVTVDGKKKRYQTRQPLATLALANQDQEPVEP
jgi:nucleoid DNA-binding protein